MASNKVENGSQTLPQTTQDGLFTVYGFDQSRFGSKRWQPINSVENPLLQEAIQDIATWFTEDQNWQPEALQTERGSYSSLLLNLYSDRPPLFERGRFFKKLHFDLPSVLKPSVTHTVFDSGTDTWLFLDPPRKIGSFPTKDDILQFPSAFFVDKISISVPDTYHIGSNWHSGAREDHNRVTVGVGLDDSATWAEAEQESRVMQVRDLMEQKVHIDRQLEVLRGEGPHSIAYMRELREVLKEKPWPF